MGTSVRANSRSKVGPARLLQVYLANTGQYRSVVGKGSTSQRTAAGGTLVCARTRLDKSLVNWSTDFVCYTYIIDIIYLHSLNHNNTAVQPMTALILPREQNADREGRSNIRYSRPVGFSPRNSQQYINIESTIILRYSCANVYARGVHCHGSWVLLLTQRDCRGNKWASVDNNTRVFVPIHNHNQ